VRDGIRHEALIAAGYECWRAIHVINANHTRIKHRFHPTQRTQRTQRTQLTQATQRRKRKDMEAVSVLALRPLRALRWMETGLNRSPLD